MTKKTKFFGPITTKEEAHKVLKEASWAFYFVGGLNLLVGYFLLPSVIVDGVIWVVMGFLLSQFQNKIMAGIIGLFACITLVITFMARFGAAEGGTNIFLAILLVYVAYRVWMAVNYLKK